MQPSETGCKAPAAGHLAGPGVTGEDQSASNPAESPPPTAPTSRRHPPELHQNPPFSAVAGSRQHGGIPGELCWWKGDAQTPLPPFRSRWRRCFVSMLLKTVLLQQLFKPSGFNFKYSGNWARHSYLLVKRQLIGDVSFEGQGWDLPRREPSQVFLALMGAGNRAARDFFRCLTRCL